MGINNSEVLVVFSDLLPLDDDQQLVQQRLVHADERTFPLAR
jgi:hypothetical protein